jgi:hypothetical protein
MKTTINNQVQMTKRNSLELKDIAYRNCSIPIGHRNLAIGFCYP